MHVARLPACAAPARLYLMETLPHAHGGAPLRGVMRATPDDFFVDEELGFSPDGHGEHLYLRVEKRGANTEFVARELAALAGVRPESVGYAGMKDRHAVTRQTFCLHLPGKPDPDWLQWTRDDFRVLSAARHGRKLQRGALKANRFRIVVRQIEGDRAAAARIIAAIAARGVPNYFGEQRFGRQGANVSRAQAMFAGRRVPRHERSMLLSAARSQLFNAVLAARVVRGDWDRASEGDVFMLAGSHSIFGPEPIDAALQARCASGDVDPTGPLWGSGALRSGGEIAAIETAVAAQHAALAEGLCANGLRQERRALRLRAAGFSARERDDDAIEFEFSLRAGAYATVVLRELFAA